MYYNQLEIAPSAHRHGVAAEDIAHAVEYLLLVDHEFEPTDPPKVLVLGPDRNGNLLEVIGVDEGRLFRVFHAMAMRPVMLKLLDPKRGG